MLNNIAIDTRGSSSSTSAMKSVQIKEFARTYNFDDVISMSDQVERPKRKPAGTVLIRVIACSLAPGDCRVASGHTELIQGPKKFPYIPGGDISGIVEEVDEDKSRFKVGEAVIAIFKSPRPFDGLAEYIVVDEKRVEKFDSEKIDFLDAVCLPSSALAALNVVSTVMQNDKVMVLGGSGGVGPFLVQLCKLAGAKFVACTSTQQAMMEELGVDRVIDYTTTNWWELEEFQTDPFDLVFDCVGGPTGWKAIRQCKALKRSSDNGRFVALTFDNPLMQVHNYWQLVRFVSNIAGRAFWNRLVQRSIPYYRLPPDALKVSPASFKTLVDHVEAKRLKVVIDPKGPFEFTQTGVTEAFKLQASRHAHGKVVVRVASN
jgi:NADPH:quinone reductase-like Zn-dependent oxidoreductase